MLHLSTPIRLRALKDQSAKMARRRSRPFGLLGLILLALALFAPSASADFGMESFAAGSSSLQAGGHGDMTTSFVFNSHPAPGPPFNGPAPDADGKNVVVQLPAGFAGNPQSYPRCASVFLAQNGVCPTSTQIGIVRYRIAGHSGLLTEPVYNMVPGPGHPADIAFFNHLVASVPVHILISVRTGGDYGITATAANIPANLKTLSSSIVLWGIPGDPSHDSERGSIFDGGCIFPLVGPIPGCELRSQAAPNAFLSNPTQCGVQGQFSITADSWEVPGEYLAPTFAEPQQFSGCDKLTFEPSLTLQPQSHHAGEPSAYTVDLHVPQSDSPVTLATPHLKKAVVTLPQGVRVSPSAADGLQACSDAQISINTADDPSCPEASTIGTVKVITPLLPDPLEGVVYQGTQTPGHLLRLFLAVKGPGILVKLAGSIDLNPSTGQITTTFDNNPQLPFEDFILSFKGGPRAPLSNPTTCGTYTTTSDLTPWSTPITPDATPSDSFQINEGCAAHGFSPSFVAGTTSSQAGAFSPFTVTIARTDSDQELSGIRVQTPPGALGMLKSVALCGEANANAGTCPPASQIGHTTVGSGPGSNPVFLPIAGQPANPVFLTQGYKGAPFGLSVVVPAVAGPFNLGTVVERAAISVDPHTSQITITSDQLPRILQGIPLQVRSVNVTVDRPGFEFNPTSCNPLAVNATLSSYEGSTENVSSPFQASSCQGLRFAPKFSVTTNGKTSKASGASLQVHLATGEGPSTTPGVPAEANLSKVEVQLPAVLPSKLSTLQKACTSAQFEKDPAGCPSGSFVGSAVAHTPLLANPVSGPAILVSHGGAAFPDLVLMFQGEGIRLDVVGNTQIKNGVTISRFQTVPDDPVSSFDLTLPQGPHAVLAANGNLCANSKTVTTTKHVTRRVKGHSKRVTVRAKKTVATPLLMPTTFTAQNGAVVHQNTKIAVTGCGNAKSSSATAKKARKAGRASRRKGSRRD
jgi:hypothetical protein